MSAGQNLNFAVPSSLISSLIAGTNLKVTKAEVQAWESTQGNRWTWLAPEGEDILAGGLVPNTDFAGETRAWLTQNLAGARTDYRDGFRHRIENLTFSGCDITVSTSMEKGSVKLVVNHFTSMTLAENAAARKAKSGEFLVTLYFGSNITEYQQGYIDGHLVGRYYEEKTVRVIPLVVPNEDVAVRASQELNRLIKICDGSAARRP